MVIGPGLTLGAVFTLFYDLALAFAVEDDRLRFVASGAVLASCSSWSTGSSCGAGRRRTRRVGI